MNVLLTAESSTKTLWLGFSEGFWGAVIGASIPVVVGLIGVLVKNKSEKKNKNTRTFSKINYELNNFIEMIKNYDYGSEEVAIKIEGKCNELVKKLSDLNIDILEAKEVLVFYEILNIIDDIGENAYEEEEIIDDYGNLQNVIMHTTPENVTARLKELELKRQDLMKNYL